MDYCEFNPKECKQFHLTATINIGLLCKQYQSRFVYISSDYVFSDNERPVKEDDKTYPLNVYGQMKLASEKWICEHLDHFIIMRTTNVYGWDPYTITPNFIMNLYNNVNANQVFKAPSYLWGNPTYVGDLVKAMYELSQLQVNGIYHVVGDDYINRYEWALKVCKLFNWNINNVKEISSPPLTSVPRPRNIQLSNEKVKNTININLHGIEYGLRLMKQEIIVEPIGDI